MWMEYDKKASPFKQDMTGQILYKITCICVPFECKKTRVNYREFDLEGDLVGVPHTWYLSAQSVIILLQLVWSE